MSKHNLVFLTGAGLSQPSGISTFRDKNGLWENHKIDQVASYSTWKSNFELVHSFYNQRRAQLATVVPNEAHKMLARLQAKYNAEIITQNIDDLLEQAGAKDVIHVHGRLEEIICEACGEITNIGYMEFDINTKCKCSNHQLKPNVVFFGQVADNYPKMYDILTHMQEGDVFVTLGTSGQVISLDQVVFFTKATTILSNFQTEVVPQGHVPYINENLYNIVMHGDCAVIANQLEEKIIELMEA